MKRDITSYDDCLKLIQWFYDKLLLDEQISHYFSNLNLEEHIPRVADFWAFILIDRPGYQNNMMSAHAALSLKESDFEHWLKLFHETVREHFEGEKAACAIQRAQLIALTMKSKR